jgi:predicted O-linked N-acetylglucosamine transferase (SPINDLY family)
MNAPESVGDPLATALDAYRRGDAAGCLRMLEQSRSAWMARPDGWLVFGVASRAAGQFREAEVAYRQAIALLPRYTEAWQNLGNLYAAIGRHDAALDAYVQALNGERAPTDRAGLLANVAGSAFSAGRIEAAIAAVDEAIALAPEAGWAHNQRGKILWELGHTETAIAAFGEALRCDPDNALFATNLLLVSQFSEHADERDLAALARVAADRLARTLPAGLADGFEPTFPAAGERIRIAYLSSDFRASAPGFFIRGILAGHDRSRFEVWALSTSGGGDAVTDAMRPHADQWHDVSGLDTGALVGWLRAARIHVLVDLNGYTGGHRLAVFAARSATVQVTWLGYEGATHVPNMDAILGDPNVTPAALDACYSERVLRLPFDFACYIAPDYAPDVVATPSKRNGHVTFGSFNKLAKLGPATLRLWAAVLERVPDSRLLLKWRHATQPAARDRILESLVDLGIAADRVEFRDASPHDAMLAEYGDIDIALDPMPFSGGATTCDALWMGVPVVTLHGSRFASNHTVSHLNAAGLPELVAAHPDEYVDICARLASDVPALDRLRTGLREQLRHSPLCSPALFMRPAERHVETLLRDAAAQRFA